MKNNINETAKEVINLQIKALKNLRDSLDGSFHSAVNTLYKCRSKIIICGVGKSGKIASKISATMSSIGSPSFCISASDCSHGDLGRISKHDILILISYSGNTEELNNIIKYAKINKIKLIGIVSNKNSHLYRSADIKLLIPKVKESGLGIVPTSSTTTQLSLGDALSIALMRKKKISKLDFKKFHPGGNLGNKLKTASDVMLTKNKIPFVDENMIMRKALNILNQKKLGFIVIIDKFSFIKGVFTDGDLKRIMRKKKLIDKIKISKLMTKKPIKIEKNMLASDVLQLMNKKKITNVCVYEETNKKKIIGVIHVHDLINLMK